MCFSLLSHHSLILDCQISTDSSLYFVTCSNDDDDDSLPEGRFIGFYATWGCDECSGSRCLPHRQLWVSNLSKVTTQWLEVDSNS